MVQHTGIPEKLYYKIGEVAEITGVPPYVLRFWEGEFSKIRPKRTKAGQRLYRKVDVETVLKIKHLLYDEKFTIEGARRHLDLKPKDDPPKRITVEELRRRLAEIRDLLS